MMSSSSDKYINKPTHNQPAGQGRQLPLHDDRAQHGRHVLPRPVPLRCPGQEQGVQPALRPLRRGHALHPREAAGRGRAGAGSLGGRGPGQQVPGRPAARGRADAHSGRVGHDQREGRGHGRLRPHQRRAVAAQRDPRCACLLCLGGGWQDHRLFESRRGGTGCPKYTHNIHSYTHNPPAWVFNNIWKRWSSIARRHAATKSSASGTLAAQFSGYGANVQMVNRTLDVLGVRCVPRLICARDDVCACGRVSRAFG